MLVQKASVFFPRVAACGVARSVPLGSSQVLGQRCSSNSGSGNPVAQGLANVTGKMEVAVVARAAAIGGQPVNVRLVAVSKIKPVETLMLAYNEGHRCFGENYVKELLEKAPKMPSDVKWHFIGHLQSNKANSLVKGVPSLDCVESVDSKKLAKTLNKAVVLAGDIDRKLRVMVQVNSSGEGTKNGVEAGLACTELCQYIASDDCDRLELAGLMTIGAPDFTGCRVEDFETLRKCRSDAAVAIGIDQSNLDLSMGMSNDYENAILQGSTTVRVGSSIFGARPLKNA